MNLSSIGGPAAPAVAAAAVRPAAASDFRIGLHGLVDARTASAAGIAAGGVARAAPIAIGLMLGLQESETAEAGDREARRQAHDVLSALAELQRELLSPDGRGDAALHRLSGLIEVVPQAVDPALARVIGSIRLRARLELARIEAVRDRDSRPS